MAIGAGSTVHSETGDPELYIAENVQFELHSSKPWTKVTSSYEILKVPRNFIHLPQPEAVFSKVSYHSVGLHRMSRGTRAKDIVNIQEIVAQVKDIGY
jgi:hypothetical protein